MTTLSHAGMFGWLVWRDVTLAWRRKSDVLGTLVFFVMVVSLFPLTLGPEVEFLRTVAPGVVWVAALLASMLSLARLYTDDHVDGTLEQMLLTPQPTFAIVLAKVLAQWLISALPLVLMAPLAGLQFGLSPVGALVLLGSLMLGTPVVLLIGSIGAALTVGLRAAGTLTSLLVMPLYVPSLIFGAGAVQAVVWGVSPDAHVRLLMAMLILAALFAPLAAGAALRISLE